MEEIVIAIKCPACGAPVTRFGFFQNCEYCGTYLQVNQANAYYLHNEPMYYCTISDDLYIEDLQEE